MKKLSIFALCVLLLAAVTVTIFAATSTEVTLTPAAQQVHRGEEFTVTVSISGNEAFTSLGYYPMYDTNVFEIVSGEVLIPGAMLSEFSTTEGGVAAFTSAVNYSGPVFSFTLRVKDNAAFGASEITGDFAANKGVNALSVELNTTSVEVECNHSYGQWTMVDGEQHKHACTICFKEETASHAWNEGVITVAANCANEGSIMYGCTECDATRTASAPKSLLHSGTILEMVGEGTLLETCQVCNKHASWKYNVQDGTVIITGYEGNSENAEIPSYIDGMPVTAIATGAFEEPVLERLTIPATVTQIGSDAFMTPLQGIYFGGSEEQWTGAEDAVVRYLAEGSTQLVLTPSVDEAYRGDTFTVTVSALGNNPCTSLGYIPVFDSDVFEIISGEVLVKDAMLADFSIQDGGAVLYNGAAVPSGDLFRFTLRVKDTAAFENHIVTGVVAVNSGKLPVPTALSVKGVEILCRHEYSGWVTVDKDVHMHVCTICGREERASHEWNDGVVTKPSTCKEAGEITHTCLHCDETKVEPAPLSNVHTSGLQIRTADGKLKVLCATCGTEEFWTYTVNDGAVTITGYHGNGSCPEVPSFIEGLPVTAIAKDAFEDCEQFTAITIPGTVTQMDAAVFQGCPDLQNVYYCGAKENWPNVDTAAEVTFDVQASTQILVVPDASDVYRGETFTVTVYVYGSNIYTSIGYIPEFDNSVFRIVSGEVLFTDALLSDFGITTGGVAAFDPATDYSGAAFRITFAVSGDAAFGEYIITGEGAANRNTLTVPVALATQEFTVACRHEFGDWVKVDEETHSHACPICGFEEILNHVYEDGFCIHCGDNEFWSYRISGETVIITEYTGKGGEVEIPEALEDLPVVAIDPGAFAGRQDVTAIVIYDGILKIAADAFADCAGLKNIYYMGSQEQWESIAIGDGNAIMQAAKIFYSIADAVLGDLNGSDEITDEDAMYLLRHTLFPSRYPVEIPADVNNDGDTNDGDAMYLLRYTLFPNRYPLYPDSILNTLTNKAGKED